MVTALIVCATIVYIAYRMEKVVVPLTDRSIAVKEKMVAISEEQVKNSGAQPPPKADPMPQYLWLAANSESEKWAREEAMKRFRELYEEHGNWDKVIQAVGGGS